MPKIVLVEPDGTCWCSVQMKPSFLSNALFGVFCCLAVGHKGVHAYQPEEKTDGV